MTDTREGDDVTRTSSGPGEGLLLLSAAQARAQVREVMRRCALGLGHATVAEERVADAELACSELLANARRHGGGLTHFAVRCEGAHVVVEVGDLSSDVPLSPPPDRLSPGGFGWALLQRVAAKTSVRVRPDGGGKTITAHLPVE
ncbi:ATP-binding protein [Streptomyces sp. SID14478]|uniref:ATP-binding protein n=1 Tax=Streptomyces sp. SID14478 TaxID=2706073 RepID=UPI0013DE971F|nr:ATP-binding protein [Streptomyces sp. SID14478]NEB81905.1 ATP-binding protein [Streptomyces sp. SID14478]